MAVSWGSKVSSSQLTGVTTEQFFSQTPLLAANEEVVCQVTANSSGTTDSLIVSVYATLDDAAERFDTSPLYSFVLDATDSNDNDVTFVVKDVYKFRVGVSRDGVTDTFVADMSHRIATLS